MALQTFEFKETVVPKRSDPLDKLNLEGVRLYGMNTLDVVLPKNAKHILSKEELSQAERFAFPQLQHRYAIGRYALRLVLASFLGSDPSKLLFGLDSHKKPLSMDYPEVFFNLSYSKANIIIGISKNRLGVDLEFVNPTFDFVNIVESYFGQGEREFILNPTPSIDAFFLLWTRKEACLKALGIGLIEDLGRINCLDGELKVEIPEVNWSYNWMAQSFLWDKSYRICVCSERFQSDIAFYDLDDFIKKLPM